MTYLVTETYVVRADDGVWVMDCYADDCWWPPVRPYSEFTSEREALDAADDHRVASHQLFASALAILAWGLRPPKRPKP